MTEILFADDDAAMREMVADALSSQGHRVRLARNGREAIEALRGSTPDLVVLDYRMGTPDGFEVCRHVKTNPRTGHVPVLILTGEAQLENRLRGFDAGADDYLPKPFDARELLARVTALLRLARRGLDRNPTSRLPGGEAIEREYLRRLEHGRDFAVCYFDLDNFKPFNDRFGFSVADAMIRETGDLLHELIEGSDAFAGHVGGDDFLLICDPEDARPLAEQAQARFHERLARHLPPEVMDAGRYETTDRAGVTRELPLTRLSAAIVRVDPDEPNPLPELGLAVASLKDRAKRAPSGIEELQLERR
jgi:PleD family two-component response regulator